MAPARALAPTVPGRLGERGGRAGLVSFTPGKAGSRRRARGDAEGFFAPGKGEPAGATLAAPSLEHPQCRFPARLAWLATAFPSIWRGCRSDPVRDSKRSGDGSAPDRRRSSSPPTTSTTRPPRSATPSCGLARKRWRTAASASTSSTRRSISGWSPTPPTPSCMRSRACSGSSAASSARGPTSTRCASTPTTSRATYGSTSFRWTSASWRCWSATCGSWGRPGSTTTT